MSKNNLYNIGIKGAASTSRVWQFFMVYDLDLAGRFRVIIMAIPGLK